MQWLPDSGADVDAVSAESLQKLDQYLPLNLANGRDNVITANGSKLNSMGTVDGTLTLNNRTHETTLHVFGGLHVPLLSQALCVTLDFLEPGWPHS